MFKHLFTTILRSTAGRCLGACLSFCLVLLALSSISGLGGNPPGSGGDRLAQKRREQVVNQKETMPAPRHMTGAAARKYLQEPGEGQSLMQAITAARFGLKSQERGPFGETGRGYLGMSHEQNLNAWFAEDGVTVRPTVAEEERARAWHMEMRLKSYGYGNDLVAAPPIVAQRVKDNRIEYERSHCRLPIGNCRLEDSARSLVSHPQLFQSAITEWYENRAEGIEQGFTIGGRPYQASVSNEPLRLVISLRGDLRAHVSEGGRSIELTDNRGKPALSYRKLTAVDAAGKQLAARMETSAGGSELALVVDDRGASYPIVIDPIVATREQILDAQVQRQGGAQFGDAIAIDGDRVIVGAWLEDNFGSVDVGAEYYFVRSGTVWSLNDVFRGNQAQGRCGFSVAISGTYAVFGCPGSDNNNGRAGIYDFQTRNMKDLIRDASPTGGDRYGESVAVSGDIVAVGAPLYSADDRGAIYGFTVISNLNTPPPLLTVGVNANDQFGRTVAGDGSTFVIGAPGVGAGRAYVIAETFQTLQPSGGLAGDQIGSGVAISGNTLVLSAPGDDQKGTDAGAAYVFVRDAAGLWTQQQKLIAVDGKANDLFSYYSVAIEDNTIVVGARRQDGVSANPNDNRGAA
jgi:hypothetical protein